MNISFFSKFMDNGVFKATEEHDKATTVMLDELVRWTEAMKTLRA